MEKRQFVRVQLPECASIKYNDHTCFANIKNASLQGLFIEINRDVPLDTNLQITVFMPSNTSIRLNANVVRHEQSGVGVKIQSMDVNSFVNLRNVISKSCHDFNGLMSETYKMTSCIH